MSHVPHKPGSYAPEQNTFFCFLYLFPFVFFSHRTNITEEYKTYGSSRGDLVASFLSSSREDPEDSEEGEEEEDVIPRDGVYAGFNLLLLTPRRSEHALSFNATLVTNHGGGNPLTQRALSPTEQAHSGLSNGIDGQGAESWPKIQHGLDAFTSVMNTVLPDTSEEQLADDLFSLLTWVSLKPNPQV